MAMRVKPDPSQIAEVYIDESSQNNHRYLVLGCVVVALTESQALSDMIAKARLPELPHGEVKWTKVSRGKLLAYRRLVDSFFDNADLAHFHALFVDTTRQDHRRWNDGSRDTGFNKEIYQLATKCSKLYGKSLFHIYPDRRNTRQPPEQLRLILNRGCTSRGDKRDWPFRRCQFRDSHNTLALQLTDIFVGAIAYQINGHSEKLAASPAKSELAAHIMERAKIKSAIEGTARSGRFTIWPRQLR